MQVKRLHVRLKKIYIYTIYSEHSEELQISLWLFNRKLFSQHLKVALRLCAALHLVGLGSGGFSPVSRVFRRRKRPAASRMRLNSMQKAWTSMNRSWTLMILFRISDWRKTQTSRTSRFWNGQTVHEENLAHSDRGPVHM